MRTYEEMSEGERSEFTAFCENVNDEIKRQTYQASDLTDYPEAPLLEFFYNWYSEEAAAFEIRTVDNWNSYE